MHICAKKLHWYLQQSACNVFAKLKDTQFDRSCLHAWVERANLFSQRKQRMRDSGVVCYDDICKMMAKQVSLVVVFHVLSVNWQGSYATLPTEHSANKLMRKKLSISMATSSLCESKCVSYQNLSFCDIGVNSILSHRGVVSIDHPTICLKSFQKGQ